MTQKILAAAAGLDHVEAGQLIEADLDLVLGNDITSPVAIHEMEKMAVNTVFDKDKVALVMDHFIPNKDIKSAEHCKCVREFACRHKITNYFDVGEMGIEHALLPEKGLTVAGDVIIIAVLIPARMALWELSQPVWEVRTWRREWLQANAGLRCRLRSAFIWWENRANGSAEKM